jgi:hypothetical protein
MLQSYEGYFEKGQFFPKESTDNIIGRRKVVMTVLDEPTLDEQIIVAALKRNPKRVRLEADENGRILVDKEKHPDIYDWVVNG